MPSSPTCVVLPRMRGACRPTAPLGLRCRPRRWAPPSLRQSAVDGGRSGSCLASPALCARGRKAWGGGSLGPGLRGGHRGPRPRAIWTPSAGPFEVVRGGSLFARPLWLGAWRWFTASMPLNLFPGDPGSIRPGPERGCQASREIKGGTGLFIEVELRAGGALGLGCSSDPRAGCRVRKLGSGLRGRATGEDVSPTGGGRRAALAGCGYGAELIVSSFFLTWRLHNPETEGSSGVAAASPTPPACPHSGKARLNQPAHSFRVSPSSKVLNKNFRNNNNTKGTRSLLPPVLSA